MVISFADEKAEIVAQGMVSQTTFQRLFLDHYEIGGERYHPGGEAVVRGVLVASDKYHVVTVPIWAWKVEDGTTRLLCQASEDGHPPAFSVFSQTDQDLLVEVVRELGE